MRSVAKRTTVVAAALMIAATAVYAAGQAEAATGEGPVPVMLWTPGSPQPDVGAVNQAAMEYAGERIGAYPVVEWIDWAEWSEKKELAISSGEEIDLVFTAIWDKFTEHASRNAFMPLNDLIDDNAPVLRDVLGDWLRGPVLDGNILAIPTMKEAAAASAWVFKKEYADKYGVPYQDIVEPHELEPWLRVIQDSEADVVPMLAVGFTNLLSKKLPEYTPIGADIYYKDGEAAHFWKLPEVWESAEQMREWYLAGYLPPESEDPQANANNVFRKYQESGLWFVMQANQHPGHIGEWTNRYGYQFVSGPYWSKPITNNRDLLGAMHAIGQTSRKGGHAIEILELMNTDQYFNNLLNYGIEDVHYRVVDPEVPFIEKIPDAGYWPAMMWAMQNQFLNYLTVGEPADKWKRYRAWNDSAIIARDVGFFPDTSPVRTELGTIENVKAQYDPLIRLGLLDLDEAKEEFLSALTLAGVEAVEDEMERQFEAFLSGQQ